MTHAERQHRFRIIVAFALVYLFWGSTYLAIRIGVEHLGPAVLTGVRFTIAGTLMLAACAATGRRIAIDRVTALRLLCVGFLLLTAGNMTLSWAEQWVPSGLAALIVAIIPLWFLVVETYLFRGDRVSRRGLAGLALGLIGVAILLWPEVRQASSALGRKELIGALSLLLCAFAWAVGSVLSRRWQLPIDAFSATAWEMTFAGAINLGIAFATGQMGRAQWTLRGIGALSYLIVAGSWIGFSAYIWLLDHVPTAKVATYAYVNPVVAVFLGWLILHERVDAYIFAGTVVIVASVALVTRAKVHTREAELSKSTTDSRGFSEMESEAR